MIFLVSFKNKNVNIVLILNFFMIKTEELTKNRLFVFVLNNWLTC